MRKLLIPLTLALPLCLWGQVQIGTANGLPTASSVMVTIIPPTIPVGGTATLLGQIKMSDNTLNAFDTSQCLWSSATPAVATVPAPNVYPANVVTGVTTGTSVLTCTDNNITGSATLTVGTSPVITNPNSATCSVPCPLPPGTQSSAYSFTLTASGGKLPYTWSIVGGLGTLPTGLSLSGAVVSGTPSGTGTSTFTIKVCDANSNCTTLASSLTANGAAGCGPPTYPCSRTDIAIAPLGGTITCPPQMGSAACSPTNVLATGNVTGVNTCITDPDFGSTICRMTDANSITASHATVQTADSAGSVIWNCAGTSLCGGSGPTYIILKSAGGNRWLCNFTPATMVTSTTCSLIGDVPVSWSHRTPNRFFSMLGTVVSRNDVTPATQTFSTTTMFDFGTTTCLGNSINGSGGTYTLTSHGVFQQSFDDNTFGVSFSNQPGGQDHGFHFALYNVSTGHCRVVNTSTGTIVDNGVLVGNVSFSERFFIHEGHSTINPAYAGISAGPCISGTCGTGNYLWTVNSTTILSCQTPAVCGGEAALGFSQMENGTGTGNWNIHTYVSWQTSTLLIGNPAVIPPGLSSCAGNIQHTSWVNNDASDTLPIMAVYGGTCTVFNSAWQKEMVIIPQSGAFGIRENHTFNTGHNLQFDISSPLAQISPDGRFAAFGSDWMGTLGPSGTTTPGRCVLATTCRGDVFVVKLR